MKSKRVILVSWLIMVSVLLQSCGIGPAVEPKTVILLSPTAEDRIETLAAPTVLIPTLAPTSTATQAPSFTPSPFVPSVTPTATVPAIDSWLITPENLARFAQLATLGNSSLDQINLTVWAPDGARLAVAGKTGVVMLDATTWKVLWRIEFADAVKLQFSQDSSRLLVGGVKGARGLLLESATGKTLSTQLGGRLALSPDGKMVAGVAVRDALNGELIRELSQPKLTGPNAESPVEMAFSQDGRQVVSGGSGGGFTAWDVTSGEISYQMAGSNNPDYGCEGTSTNDWMVVVCAIPYANYSQVNLQVNFINLNRPNGFGRHIFQNVTNYKNQHYALLPGQSLIAWADGNKITLYDLATDFQPVQTLPTGLPGNGNLSFSPGKKDQRMAYWSERILRIWDTNPVKKGMEFGGPAVTQMAFSPQDGWLLAYGKNDGSVTGWNVATQTQLFRYPAHPEGRVGVAFSPDGKRLVSGGMGYKVRLWNLDPPSPAPLIEQEVAASVSQLAYTPDGKKLAVTYGSAYFMHLYSGSLNEKKPIQTIQSASGDYITWDGIAISPNGDRLAIGNTIGTVAVYNLADGVLLKKFDGLRRGVARRLAFSPDGALLAVSTRGLWDLKTGALLLELKTDTGSVAISPDQCLLATGQTNGTLRLWNMQTRQFIEPSLKVFASGIEDMAFSPDGRLLALANQDGDVVIWGLPNALAQPPGSAPKVRCPKP
jgi:WD40 repeat protein